MQVDRRVVSMDAWMNGEALYYGRLANVVV